MGRNREPLADFSAVRGKRLLIALSGGADSVALTCLLAEARREMALTLFAAHLDHGIRPESAEDARFCSRLCGRLGIPLHTVRIDVPSEARSAGEGLETTARRLRYRWLREVREAIGVDWIVLAHHMDDQAETVLMRLARGSGAGGIAGMRPFSGDLYRPLLGIRKQTLVCYLRERGIPWREDSTNTVADNPRNAIRLRVFPPLEECYPQAVPAAARLAETAAVEDDYLSKQTEVYIQQSATRYLGGVRLSLEDSPHPAILRRAIRALVPDPLSWDRVTSAAALSDAAHGIVELSGGWMAFRGHGALHILQNRPKSVVEAQFSLEGESQLPGLCVVTASPCAPEPVFDDPFRQALNPLALEGAVLRTRRDGDRFRPLGCGDRLLSDFLTDRKVDRPVRDCLALVAKGNRVLWVCGAGISEEVRLTQDTTRAVLLECRYPFDMNRLLAQS